MTRFILKDSDGNESDPFESRAEAAKQKDVLGLENAEIIEVDETATDGGTEEQVVAEGIPPASTDERPQTDAQAPEIVERVDAPDPNTTLPHWMLTEIEHSNGDVSVDLNKRGTQVVSNYLELEVNADCEISAEETGFEYCRYRATVETPEGKTFNAVGDAHIDEQGKNKWDLERLAETRAKKRCVKWSSAGGIAAFEEGFDE